MNSNKITLQDLGVSILIVVVLFAAISFVLWAGSNRVWGKPEPLYPEPIAPSQEAVDYVNSLNL